MNNLYCGLALPPSCLGEKRQLIWKLVKRRLMRQLNIIMYFCDFLFNKNRCINIFSYLDLRLNLMIFFSITQVVRCPCQERDWSSGDHVSVPGRAQPQLFIHTVTVYLGQVLPPSSRPHWHLLLGRLTHSVFPFCVNVFSDNWPSSARRCSPEASHCHVSLL